MAAKINNGPNPLYMNIEEFRQKAIEAEVALEKARKAEIEQRTTDLGLETIKEE